MKQLRILGTTLSVLAVTAIIGFGPAQGSPTVAGGDVNHDLQVMTYEVYAGGINAVNATLDVEYGEKNDNYRIELTAETQGFLASLVPWQGTFLTKGWNGGEKVQPEKHVSMATWRGEEDLKEYTYAKDGTFKGLKVIEAGEDKSPDKIDDELIAGTTDVLTATLEVMKNIAANNDCAGSSEIFDGKRRFEMIFRQQAEEVLEQTRYNVYEGPALRCEVEVKPIAGDWHKKPRGWMSIQEQGREKGSMPTVWLANVNETGPAVPVKVRVKTEYGTLFMHLIEYENGSKKMRQEDD